ncbi:hypothetical protein QFC24_001015 [Naganishia onofrii]|uniref:Uncharacterized protein n=1 Tax=Naganishia onofrii TaxID=1851511 RepID=A0ACC2XW63_9TREE|nr:hypothetical protein QFC24_001015 [Naganishia onofrii]
MVYLFVFGELHAAVQSRTMPHTKRARIFVMALRFLEGWKKFVNAHPDYNVSTHFISSDLHDIVRRLCFAMLGLILRFRDISAERGKKVPLFPWRHSTEMFEHFFGMGSRVETLMGLDCKSTSPTESSADDQRPAKGYHHTYNDLRFVNVDALSTFGSDQEFEEAFQEGTKDAVTLLDMLQMLSAITDDIMEADIQLPPVDASSDRDSTQTGDDETDWREEESYRTGNDLTPEDIIHDLQGKELSAGLETACVTSAFALTSLEIEANDLIDSIPEDDLNVLLTESLRQSALINQPVPKQPDVRIPWPDLRPNTLLPVPQSELVHHQIQAMLKRRKLNECEYLSRRNERYGSKAFCLSTAPKDQDVQSDSASSLSSRAGAERDAQTGQTLQSLRASIFNKMLRYAPELGKRMSGNTAGIARGLRWTGKVAIAEESTEHEKEKRLTLQNQLVKKAQESRNKVYADWLGDRATGREGILDANVSMGEDSNLQRGDLVVFVIIKKGPAKDRAQRARVSLGIVKLDRVGNPANSGVSFAIPKTAIKAHREWNLEKTRVVNALFPTRKRIPQIRAPLATLDLNQSTTQSTTKKPSKRKAKDTEAGDTGRGKKQKKASTGEEQVVAETPQIREQV